jgi:hypothetical protein
MGLKDEKLPALFRELVIIVIVTFMFIFIVSGETYSISPSPVIFTNMNPGPDMSITITGQNFTPNGIAVLHSLNDSYTANVDANGNTSWTYTNGFIAPYQIYAVDMNTNVTSNTITVSPRLNDYTPSPTPTPFPASLFIILSICSGALIYMHKKKFE